MNLDDLKTTWQQRHSETADGCIDELASNVVTRTSRFERSVLIRDLIETVAAIAVIVFFGYYIQQNIFSWITSPGTIIVIVAAIQLIVVMHWTRRRGGRPRYDLSLKDFCDAELARVDRQIKLIRNVNYWYTAPLLLGAAVFMFEMMFSEPDVPLLFTLSVFGVFCVILLMFGWLVYWINQRSVRKNMMPFREELWAISQSLTECERGV